MAISKETSIDFAKIATEMRDIVSRWYNATLEVVDPNTGDLTWNISTNSYTGDAATTIWSGKGRVQPIRGASEPNGRVYDPSMRPILIQIPYDNTLDYIRPGMTVRVTNGGENHYLEELEISIVSTINSSYGWNTTLECSVDTKSVANGS